jgi:hypothetical protein
MGWRVGPAYGASQCAISGAEQALCSSDLKTLKSMMLACDLAAGFCPGIGFVAVEIRTCDAGVSVSSLHFDPM